MPKKKHRMINKESHLPQIKKIKNNFLFFQIFVIIILNFFLISSISNNQFYKAFHHGFQMILFVLLFNAVLILFINFESPFLKSSLTKKILIAVGFLTIVIYVLSFFPVLDINGDNAKYLLRAKSIVDGNGFRDIYLIGEPYNVILKSIGFSFLFIPLFFLFGFNIFIFKLLPLLLTFLFFYLLYYFYKDKEKKSLLFLLIIFVMFNSQIIHFSSMVMTENVMMSLMMILFCLFEKYLKLKESSKTIIFTILLSVFTFFLFTVREAGVGILAVFPLYLLIKRHFKRLFVFIIVLCFLFAGYVTYSSHLKELNQKLAYQDKKAYSVEYYKKGWIKIYLPFIRGFVSNAFNFKQIKTNFIVVTQKIIGDPDHDIATFNFLKIVVFLLLLIGIYSKIKKKEKITYFDLFGIFTYILLSVGGNSAPVKSRYFIILIPLIYLYFFKGLRYSTHFLPKIIRSLIFIVVSGLMLINLFSINCRAIYSAKKPYPPSIQFYVKSAKWINSNLNKNIIIGTRKGSLYYIWSQRKCVHYFSSLKYDRRDVWSQQFEQDTLDYYKNTKIDYIILDSFSSDAYNKILPIIQHHPEKFKVVYSPSQFNIPENYIKDTSQLLAIFNNYYQKTHKVFVPTVVLEIK